MDLIVLNKLKSILCHRCLNIFDAPCNNTKSPLPPPAISLPCCHRKVEDLTDWTLKALSAAAGRPDWLTGRDHSPAVNYWLLHSMARFPATGWRNNVHYKYYSCPMRQDCVWNHSALAYTLWRPVINSCCKLVKTIDFAARFRFVIFRLSRLRRRDWVGSVSNCS